MAFDDDWRLAEQDAKRQTGLAPSDDRESAIIANVSAPTTLTAILRGKNNTTGVGVIEVYDLDGGYVDLDQGIRNQVANLSTRGFVGTGQNVMIGGFIVGTGGSGRNNGTTRVIVRALGPSLESFGVAGALKDPKLSLRDTDGTQIAQNDDWRQTQQKEIEASGLQPSSLIESAIVATLAAGNYTAIVEGFQGGTGVGLVEVYNVN